MPDRTPQRAEELFKERYCCAESVLMAIAESRGVKSDLIPRVATGFCGGLGRSGGVCGAVSGAIMGLGLVFGRDKAGQSPERVHQIVRHFLADFETRFGSTQCERLIGLRLDTAAGHQLFIESNLREKCAGFVEEAARLAGEAINKNADA